MHNYILLIIISALMSGINISAEEDKNPLRGIALGFAYLDFGGGLRLRGQMQNNFNIKRYQQGKDGFAEERLRLEFNLKFIENMRFFIQLQDAHVFDPAFTEKDFYPPYSPYQNPLDIRQFFIEYQNIAATAFGVKIGRQTVFYGDNRILGPGEWCNVGRYFWDGAKLSYRLNKWKTDLFAAKQVMSNPYEIDIVHSPVFMGGIYSVFTFFNPATDLFCILKSDKMNGLRSYTAGSRVDGNFSMLFYSGTFAYQFGDTGTKKINAYGYNTKLGYLLPKLWMSEIGIEYSFASGDNDLHDKTYKTFDGVFGAIDLFYGRMALFSWMNLKDYQINLDIKPTRTFSITMQYHWFELAEKKDAWYYGNGKKQRHDPTGAAGRFLGQEALMFLRVKINRYLETLAGYCYFLPGEFIKNTAGYNGESSLAVLQTEFRF